MSQPTNVDAVLLENVSDTLMHYVADEAEQGNVHNMQACLIVLVMLARSSWDEFDLCHRAADRIMEQGLKTSIAEVVRSLGGQIESKPAVKTTFAKAGVVDYEQIVRAINILRVYSACPASYARDILIEAISPFVKLEEV